MHQHGTARAALLRLPQDLVTRCAAHDSLHDKQGTCRAVEHLWSQISVPGAGLNITGTQNAHGFVTSGILYIT